MSNMMVFKALSSDSRREILYSLSNESKSVDTIAEEIGLKPVTVRHHIIALLGAGLIDEIKAARRGVGRPTTLYKRSDAAIRISYPKRDYMLLSQILVGGLRNILGEETSKHVLFEIAREAGISYVKGLALENGVDNWTLNLFRDLFVEKLMTQMGTRPQIVSQSGGDLIYIEKNCLFFEMAKWDKELVCNALDSGFHKGIVDALGPDFSGERLSCQGHGDTHCKYQIRWNQEDTSSQS